MFRQSAVLSSLLLVSLISCIGCDPEPFRIRRIEDVAPSNSADPRCVSNQGNTWKEDCNSCWCIDGGHVACTRKMCLPKNPDPKCVNDKGLTWKDECNTCWCANGKVLCTRMNCLPEKRTENVAGVGANTQTPQTDILTGQNPRCQNQTQPSESWKDGCNTCFCLSNGMTACTGMACDLGLERFGAGGNDNKIEEDDARCLSGNITAPWQKECNTCFCLPKVGAACTRKGCPPPEPVAADHSTHQKTKRDTKQRTVDAFVRDDTNRNGTWKPSPLIMSNARTNFPGVWTATAVLATITAILTRI